MNIAPLTPPNQPFPFFSLPSELRFKILSYALTTDQIIDLSPKNPGVASRHRLNIFLTSHRLHHEASSIFYSGHTFRIFPTHGRFFGHKVRPLISRLPSRYRAALVSVELRLGPGWNNPPASWRVDDGLGLEEMEGVRTVKVFVECDPSCDIFNGFRINKSFFTGFSADLLEGVLRRLPSVVQVELDGWPSVKREGQLVKRLLEVASDAGVRVLEVARNEDCDEVNMIPRARRKLNYPIELD